MPGVGTAQGEVQSFPFWQAGLPFAFHGFVDRTIQQHKRFVRVEATEGGDLARCFRRHPSLHLDPCSGHQQIRRVRRSAQLKGSRLVGVPHTECSEDPAHVGLPRGAADVSQILAKPIGTAHRRPRVDSRPPTRIGAEAFGVLVDRFDVEDRSAGFTHKIATRFRLANTIRRVSTRRGTIGRVSVLGCIGHPALPDGECTTALRANQRHVVRTSGAPARPRTVARRSLADFRQEPIECGTTLLAGEGDSLGRHAMVLSSCVAPGNAANIAPVLLWVSINHLVRKGNEPCRA